MTQINAFDYRVVQGEPIRIVVTPMKVGPNVIASKAGATLSNIGGPTPTFSFGASSSGTDIVKLVCNFPGMLDPDARYVVNVSGAGGENFQGPIINKDDPVHDPNLNFMIQ